MGTEKGLLFPMGRFVPHLQLNFIDGTDIDNSRCDDGMGGRSLRTLRDVSVLGTYSDG